MVVQHDEAWLATATPEQIDAADKAGELDALQSRVVGSDPRFGTVPGLQRDQAWVDGASPEDIAAAMDAGELDALLGRRPWPTSEPTAKPAQGLYGDGTIRTHEHTPRGDLPVASGPVAHIPAGVDPKDA